MWTRFGSSTIVSSTCSCSNPTNRHQADQYLAQLHGQRSLVRRSPTSSARCEYDPVSGDHIVRVDAEPPPLRWGLTVSQFAHLLRSSLDNILWALIEARQAVPTPDNQFPILTVVSPRTGKHVDLSVLRGRAETMTQGVRPDDFTFIEGLQPYKAGLDLEHWQPLAMLAHLNDIDKHRYIHVGYIAAGLYATKGPRAGRLYPMGSDTLKRVFPDDVPVGALPLRGWFMPHWEDGAEITSGRIHYGGSDDPTEVARISGVAPRDAKMLVKPDPTIDISFSDREMPMTIDDLIDIRDAVVGIYLHFRPIIDQP